MTTAVEAGRGPVTWSPWSSAVIVATVVAWSTAVLVLDGDSSRWLQRLLGLATWAVLAVIVSRESPLVRTQTAVVVVFATMIEFTCSPLLGVYVYRFHNVPMYVPPGHGLVYLAALAIGRSLSTWEHARVCKLLALTGAGGYAVAGLSSGSRPDVLGALWFLCLAAFLLWGPSPGLYVGATLVVTYIELVGTSSGAWTWQPHDPTGFVSVGNPPSGAAGGYGWFDIAAIMLAPALLTRLRRVTGTLRRRRASRRPAPLSRTHRADFAVSFGLKGRARCRSRVNDRCPRWREASRRRRAPGRAGGRWWRSRLRQADQVRRRVP